MKKVSTQIYFQIFRAAVLYAVLCGLLFSCGEGIRLFPFPAPELSTANQTFLIFETEIPYQYNAHRFEKNQGNQNSKSQTDNSNHFWLTNGHLKTQAVFISTAKRENDNFSFRETIKLPQFSESGKSRAPPLNDVNIFIVHS